MKHKIEIPENYLLLIAVGGNLGDDKLPGCMRIWAQGECEKLGLSGKVKTSQTVYLNELKTRLKNKLGEDNFKLLENSLEAIIKNINETEL